MTQPDPALRACLPPSLAELVDVIGVAATLALAERCGGMRVYVPMEEHLSADHELVKLLGEATARELSRARAKEILDVPHAAAYLRELRDREIRAAYQAESADRLASRYRLSRRQIFVIVGGECDAGAQSDLFGKT